MSTSPSLLVDHAEGVATLTFNRPEVGNALNTELLTAFGAAAREVAEDSSVRCVVLRGKGRLFCAGGDISTFASAGEDGPAMVRGLADTMHQGMSRLMRMPKPLVVAVNGPAAGAGFAMAMMGDVVIAGKSAQFTVAYSQIGLTPDGGASWLLPRLVGLRRAQELALTGRRLTAEEALQMGLLTRVVDDDALDAECEAVARSLAGAATGALGRTRQLLMSAYTATLEDQMDAEAQSISESLGTEHGREGVAAFLEKRRPIFG